MRRDLPSPRQEGFTYSVFDITADPYDLEMVRRLGYLQAPVVIAGDTHWSGFSPDQITALTA